MREFCDYHVVAAVNENKNIITHVCHVENLFLLKAGVLESKDNFISILTVNK